MTQTFSDMRAPLGQICSVPERIISVYSLEKHIWHDNNSLSSIKGRKPELKTIAEFEIDPVRHFLNDILRNMAAPYIAENKSNPIGQGYWVQAEFGSGKSHLMCFLGALALGSEDAWEAIRLKEEKSGRGKRESLYQFWENGLKQKANSSKGFCIVAKTLVGSGGGTVGLDEPGKPFTEYLIDAVKDQLLKETGKNISLYPVESLVDRFLKQDETRYRKDLEKFLKDPNFFEEDEFEEYTDFIKNMQENRSPEYKRSCGNKLWKFYTEYLKVRPDIEMETEDVLRHLVKSVMAEGYCGLIFLIDEVSLFMKDRKDEQKTDDEKTLVVLSNRLAKVENLPVWTVCAAQQVIESKTAGTKNIIADDRLKLIPLLQKDTDYYTIVLARVRQLTNPKLVTGYYNYYKRGFSWPSQIGYDEFERFFPFHKTGIEVLRDITMELTTARSAIHFMHQTLKYAIKTNSRELIRLWHFFDESLEYEEDPSGTYAGLVALKTKRDTDYKIYESCKKFIDEQTKGVLKVHRERAINSLQVLFLYYVSKRRLQGLTPEEIANEILIEKSPNATLEENVQHYEFIASTLKKELRQITETPDEKGKSRFKFNPIHTGINPQEEFDKIKTEVEANEKLRKEAWDDLLEFKEWNLKTRMMTIDLAYGGSSIFSEIANNGGKEITLYWQNGEISGNAAVKDLTKYISGTIPFPTLNTEETEQDFQLLIGKTPVEVTSIINLLSDKKDPRVVIWTPDALKQEEQDRVNNFATYKKMIDNWSNKESEDAKTIVGWVSDHLKTEIGLILKVVTDSYQRGRMDALNHQNTSFQMIGNLPAIIAPVVERILTSVYESRIIIYPQNIPFCKEDGVKVINGIVKKGEIPTNVTIGKNESAAQNFGPSLIITSTSNWRKLDTSQNTFVTDIFEFINSKITDPHQTISIASIYKNFTGLNGPNNKNYGLTKRVIDIYLLCLVKQGKIRINLGNKSILSFPFIDYSNIDQIDFNARTISSFSEIQKMVRPKSWDALHPYIEVILGLKIPVDSNDSQITEYRAKLTEHFKTKAETSQSTLQRSSLLFEKIRVKNPYSTDVEKVNLLFNQKLGSEEIDGLAYALKVAFGFKVFDEEKSNLGEVSDLSISLANYENICKFMEHENDLLLMETYRNYKFPKSKELEAINKHLESIENKLTNITPYVDSNTKLKTELIGDALRNTGDQGTVYGLIKDYLVLYKAMHEYILTEVGTCTRKIDELLQTDDWKVINSLQEIGSLQPKKAKETTEKIKGIRESCFACSESSIASIDLRIKTYPEHNCGLSFANSENKIENAKQALVQAETIWKTTTKDTTSFFLSSAIKEKLEQGNAESCIKDLLDCKQVEDVMNFFKNNIAKINDIILKINKYLKKIEIRIVNKNDFQPTVKTVEENQIDQVAEEFKDFLQKELDKISHDKDTLRMIRID